MKAAGGKTVEGSICGIPVVTVPLLASDIHSPARKKLITWHVWLLLLIVLLLGLGIRLRLARAPGYGPDIAIIQGWARSVAEFGVVHSYQQQLNGSRIPNYPPLSIAAFGVIGWAHKTFVPPTSPHADLLFHIGIKLPGIIADLLTCILLFLLFAHVRGKSDEGLLAAGVYAIHPSVLYDSSVWGQADSLPVFLIVAALYAYCRRSWALTGVLFVLAVFTKQHTILFAPFFFFLFLSPAGGVANAAIGGFLATAIILTPFIIGGSVRALEQVYTNSVGYYPTLGSSAYNLWWGLFADAAEGKSDTDLLFGFATYRTFALLLFGAIYAGLLYSFRHTLWRTKPSMGDARILVGCAALVVYAFFVFNVEMHERYLFPYMALGIPFLMMNRRTALAYVVSSMFFLINLLGILPWTTVDKRLFAEFPLLDAFVGTGHVFLFFITWLFVWEFQTHAVDVPRSRT